MRIVLLGATGFLGHYVLPALSAAGHDCVALTRYKPGCRDLSVVPRVSIKQQKDWGIEALVDRFEGADAVVNMVGILNEKGRDGDGFRKVHVALVEQAVEACRRAGITRFVQVSALGAGEGSSHYLQSKGEAEAYLKAADDMQVTIIQPSVIFGRGDDFFNRFATLLKLSPFLPLACPDARMQPVWAGDVATLLAKVLDDPETAGETLVAVGPRKYSLKELVEYTAEAAGVKRPVIGLPDGISRMQAMVMDFVPGKPFSTDNFRSLQTPNTSDNSSLPRFDIQPRSIESLVPDYLGQSKHQQRLDASRRQSR
ncbi:MAG: complex I NDUFA9 subunit family protein [Xanthomonadales bacterium]|nr:complex I NDUFA9 subunit family protein [Gammaproteobacteria bacterium]MBT8050210.1 complex I NDUFA9 subunit family protein [Gammaproteobacteria bacterium]MBT8056235.1 complex I NDUFA9 subunit family protein [Gammaproteobacteria bacterium]NNJ77901.1 complex I NDUFA9 subunit family protein [Xanthomonadales bacterium]NNL04092.1 complex I NDUFA9 subunit family protein [Xanthomonadales bacterium]